MIKLTRADTARQVLFINPAAIASAEPAVNHNRPSAKSLVYFLGGGVPSAFVEETPEAIDKLCRKHDAA